MLCAPARIMLRTGWRDNSCLRYQDKTKDTNHTTLPLPQVQYADSLNLNNGLYIIRIWLYIIWHWLYIIGSRRDYRNCNILRLLLRTLSHESHTCDGTLKCPLQFSYVFAIFIHVCNFNISSYCSYVDVCNSHSCLQFSYVFAILIIGSPYNADWNRQEETRSELVLGKRDWKYGQTCFVTTTVNRRNTFCCVKWFPLLISSFLRKAKKIIMKSVHSCCEETI